MGVIDWLSNIVKNLFSISGNGWVKRISTSSLNIENCNGEAKEDSDTRTCALCVALNGTIFRNDNKPNYYHMNCKCVNVTTDLNNVVLDFPMDKITKYLFKDTNKLDMMKSMGYNLEDYRNVYDQISSNITNNFISNKYLLKELNNHGQHIQINFVINGKNEHVHEKFSCHSGCVVWPNGKIRVATPLIKDKRW